MSKIVHGGGNAPAMMALAILAAIGFTNSSCGDVTVLATANIYGAGHSTPPAPAGGGAGILPYLVTLPQGCTRFLRFESVTGMISSTTPAIWLPADGANHATNLNSWGGISGIVMSKGFPLVGVFCSNAEPVDPAPPRMNFSSGVGFARLSPLLNQMFYIGDGLTGQGAGAQQLFVIPEGATRLFLGFPDGGNLAGNPGLYGDNQGSLQVRYAISICASDFNCDHVIDFFDYLDFVEAFAQASLSSDFNHDGVVDFFDYLDFAAAFSAGC